MTDFQNHLERIRLASKRAAEILSMLSVVEDVTSASVALAWEHLFDTLCNNGEVSLSDLSTIAGVMQKLHTICSAQKQGKEESSSTLSPEEIIRYAEEQLKLL